ncbi:YabP/YqfC family sporulation protein [Alicyclobacillus vulcanalis]|uniref:Sporulation protein YqfC n=1 Tax=Alicyclobacillus vulcanalis TaxID=252246 RepID=A0A1N7KYX1_9BACL|nr:YabP/YqfC family sporulation protein [Alicyclobacillus vulcanalis]SIS66747.1 sporulation protein YqfC [Alicyclobacillus vulcanalis]
MPGWTSSIKRRAGEMLRLPPDAVESVARVTLVGDHLIIEGAKALLEISSQRIVCDLGDRVVHIEGDAFVIKLVTDREIHAVGRVRHLSFGGGGV